MGPQRTLKPEHSFQLDLSSRGYVVLFRPDQPNHCPGCGHSQWFIGRVSAECGICGTALPLADANQQSPIHGKAQKAVALHMVGSKRKAASGAERRREERIPTPGLKLGLFIDGSPHALKVENMSSGGLKAVAIPGMDEAQTLLVELEDGRMLPAELRWSDDGFAGLAFLSEPEG